MSRRRGNDAQMDLFEAAPMVRDDRDGWVQADLFFAAAEEARELRLTMGPRRIERPAPPVQSPLMAAVREPGPSFACPVADCRRRFPTEAMKDGHIGREHGVDDEHSIRARIQARLADLASEAGEDRREGEVA